MGHRQVLANARGGRGIDLRAAARLHETTDRANADPAVSIAGMHLGFTRYNVAIFPPVALTLYLATVTLSIFQAMGPPRPMEEHTRERPSHVTASEQS